MHALRLQLALLVLAGCRFGIDGVDVSGPDGGSPVDLSASSDLAGASDGAAARLDLATLPDLAPDPCAGPTAPPPPGVTPARCAVGTPFVIDGKLDEWTQVPFALLDHGSGAGGGSGSWSGVPAVDDADISATFALQWDRTNLYFAAHVSDDVRGLHAPNKTTFLFEEDAIELYLDGDYDRTDAYGADDYQLIVTEDNRSILYKDGAPQGPLPNGVKAVSVQDAVGAGWTFEASVPWSLLGGKPVVAGRTIGFDLALDDDDNPTTSAIKHFLLWWQNPDAQGGKTQPCCSTHAMGAAQLLGR